MRSLVSIAAAAAALAAAAAPALGSTPAPCSLVSQTEAARAVMLPLLKQPIVDNSGLSRQCEYVSPGGGDATVTIQTRAIKRALFVSMAKAQEAPVKPVRGVGQLAYSTGGDSLLAWRNGLEVRVYLVDPVAHAVAAMRALALDALQHA